MKNSRFYKITRANSLAFSLIALCAINPVANAQLNVDEDGNVEFGNISVSSEGDVEMDGLSTDSEGNVTLGDISVSADGSVVLPGLRVESNGSVSMGSNFDADTLSDTIDDEGDSANLIVLFETGSADLTSQGQKQVAEIADAISYLGNRVKIEIQGHTDSVGNDSDNLDLSLARSETVVSVLTQKHEIEIPLTATGKGEKEPVANNDDDVGRQLNRRVTIVNLGRK